MLPKEILSNSIQHNTIQFRIIISLNYITHWWLKYDLHKMIETWYMGLTVVLPPEGSIRTVPYPCASQGRIGKLSTVSTYYLCICPLLWKYSSPLTTSFNTVDIETSSRTPFLQSNVRIRCFIISSREPAEEQRYI